MTRTCIVTLQRCECPEEQVCKALAGPAAESARRKATPIASGVLFYFPDALAEVARLSKAGNDKHNPGEPLHWSRGKSNDHADCIARHLIDAGPDQCAIDEEDGILHATKTAWRALANLQVVLEKVRGKA